MTRKLSVLEDAEAELAADAEWYEARRDGLGLELMAAVDDAIRRISDFPEGYPLWKPGYPYRKFALRRFPFVIFYLASESSVEIFAIAHAKRKPGYWLGRRGR